jgi:hypothetical protein
MRNSLQVHLNTFYLARLPVPMAARSKARTVFNRSNTGNVGSSSARGMNVCPHFSMLCCPVKVVTLRRADPQSKESYPMSKNRFVSFRSQILNRKRPEGIMRIYFTLINLSSFIGIPNSMCMLYSISLVSEL